MRLVKFHFPASFYLLILLCIFCLCFQLIVAEGASMEPNIQSGDVLLKIFPYREPQVGDIVVIRHQGILMVKRVAAVAGQKAIAPDDQYLQQNVVGPTSIHYENLDSADYLRGFDLWGTHLYWNHYNYWSTDSSAAVPEGYIFVVGDNLSKSYDSRYEDFGLISTDQVKGYIILRLWEGGGSE